MARVELENLLGVSLYRTVFTGTSYTVEPPDMVPANATVFWQTDDTGSATYSTVASTSVVTETPTVLYQPALGFPGTSSALGPGSPSVTNQSASVATGAPGVAVAPDAFTTSSVADATTVVAPQPGVSQVGEPLSSDEPPIGYAPVTAYPPAHSPTGPRQAIRPITFVWQFFPSGRPRFSTGEVAAGVRVDMRESFDGALFTVTPAHRRRAPVAPRRRAFVIATSLAASLLILALVTGAAYGLSGFGIIGNLLHRGAHAHPVGLVPPPTISLSSSQPSATVGTAITLTATVNSPSLPGGYEIDIVNVDSNQVVAPSPCVTSTLCTVSVVSADPNTVAYQAYVERGFQRGVLATSVSVTLTWLPHIAPTQISLSANPSADGSGTVHTQIGKTVTLTARTDLPVETAGYQIAIREDNGNLVGQMCTLGKTCSVNVKRTTQGTSSYTAYIESTSGKSVQMPSNTVQVIWSRPPLPTNVSLAVSDASPMVGQSVTLTADASSPLDYTGGEIAIFDTNGNRVSGTCSTGSRCTASVTSATSASNVYIAHVEMGNLSGIAATSSTVSVSWSVPTISLIASKTNPAWGDTVTLTATSSHAVDGSGYVIQIEDLTDGIVELKYCQSGKTCAVTISGPGHAETIDYTAYIDQRNPNDPTTSIARSDPVTVVWPAAPAPVVNLQASNTTFSQPCLPGIDTPPTIDSYKITLDNTGSNVAVGWQIADISTEASGTPWASMSESSGTIAAGQSKTITVNPDAGICQDPSNPFNGTATIQLSFPQGGSQPNIHLSDSISH